MLVTGRLRRVHVRGQEEIRKRLPVQAAAFNLGLMMRKRHGVGTPRNLQGLAAARAALSRHAGTAILRFFRSFCLPYRPFGAGSRLFRPQDPSWAQNLPCFGAGVAFSPGTLENHFFHEFLGLWHCPE